MFTIVVGLASLIGGGNPEAKVTYHVAPNGSDRWSGRLAQPNNSRSDGPFATPGRARDAARKLRQTTTPAGGPLVVHLQGGRYELREPLVFTPEDSGSAASPLIFTSAPGETVVLSGGRIVTPRMERGIWVLPVPEVKSLIPHLVVGGQRRNPTRWPKKDSFTIAGLAGADPRSRYNTPADRFEYAEGQIDPNWKNWDDIEVYVLHFWVDGHYRIKEIDREKRVVTLDRKSLRRFTEDGGVKPGRFYVRNVPRELDAGEFHHDRAAGVVRYRPLPGETVEKSLVVVPRLESLVRFEGRPTEGKVVQHVELHGLTMSDTTFVPGTKNAGDLQASQHVLGSIHLRGSHKCAITGCKLLHLGGYGIELAEGCRANRIQRNEVGYLGGGGIRLSGGAAKSLESTRTGENEIADNHLHDLGEVYHASVGILAQHTDRNAILHNHIHHVYYTGISVGWVWGYAASVSVGNRIEGNRIHDIGRKLLSDMGGIYLLGVSPGTTVRRNVIHDVESFGYGGWGIYTDEGSTGIVIEDNLVYRTKSGGFHQHYGKENVVRNNIFALAREGQLMRSRAEPHQSFTLERNIVYAQDAPIYAKTWKDGKFKTDYNLFWDASGKTPTFPVGSFANWQAQGHDRHSLIADPKFVDPQRGDFRLQADSPAVKLGFKPFDSTKAGVRK